MKNIMFKVAHSKNEDHDNSHEDIKELQSLDPRIGQVIIVNDAGSFYGYVAEEDDSEEIVKKINPEKADKIQKLEVVDIKEDKPKDDKPKSKEGE